MIRTREQVGMADGKPVVAALSERYGEALSDILAGNLADAPLFLLKLIIAHDGSLAEALSRAIVARANEIGLQVLALPQPQISPKGEKQ